MQSYYFFICTGVAFNITLHPVKRCITMPIIKLDATGSTNDYLRDLLKETQLEDYTVAWADYQRAGRGQRERSWQSEKGKNLIISILKHHKELPADAQFQVNRAVALAILKTLNSFNIPDLTVKWPNDILSGGRKLCGILIENSIKGKSLRHSIIGIGLNVNQQQFEDLPNAISLAQITGEAYDRDMLLYHLISALKVELSVSSEEGIASQKEQYTSRLFKKGCKVSFGHASGAFEAVVAGVTESGALLLELEDGVSVPYGIGEIRWTDDPAMN